MEGRVDTAAADLLSGRYELGKPLGSGGMADVYAARDRVLGRDVAIKFFRPLDEDADRARFVAEARMLARLCHPGLVTVYDAHLDGRRPCLIMQLVGGGTLRRHISTTGPLPSDDVAALGARLADALDHVHANGIVHRDIKPSNVLIDYRGAYYLADFGLAWALGSIHLTNPGEMVGTTCYLAPEQVTGTDVGPAADIYALGLVLLECLTGRTEYAGTDVESAIARLQRPPSVPTTLGPAWQKLLAAMTRYRPGHRPDASTCARLLRTIAHDGPLALPAGDIDPPTTRVDAPKTGRRAARASRSGRLHAGLGAAGAAGVVLTALMLGTPSITDGEPAPGDRAPEEPPPPPTQVHEPPRYHNDEPATPRVPPAAPPPRTGAMQTGVTQTGEAAPPDDDGRKAGKAPAGKRAPGRQGAKPGNAG
jgi:eukaryotic-like serine/threonine-protein kinase